MITLALGNSGEGLESSVLFFSFVELMGGISLLHRDVLTLTKVLFTLE